MTEKRRQRGKKPEKDPVTQQAVERLQKTADEATAQQTKTISRKTTATWTSSKPTEIDGVSSDGRRLRIKQSVGKAGPDDTFWYCYSQGTEGMSYLGVEKTLDLAKSRTICGQMRRAGGDLEEWLKKFSDRLPPDLLESERARLEHWKKFPQRAAETEKPKAGSGGSVSSKLGAAVQAATGAAPVGRAAKPERVPGGKSGNPGKIPLTAVVHVVKRAPTGKPGTKWRQRQEHVFGMDGKTVGEIRDNDAVKHMLQDGTIRIEEKK